MKMRIDRSPLLSGPFVGVVVLVLQLLPSTATLLFLGGAIAAEPFDPVQQAQRYADAYAKVLREAEAQGVEPDVKGNPTLRAMEQEWEKMLHGQPEAVNRTFRSELEKRLEPIQKAYVKGLEQKRAADQRRARERLDEQIQRRSKAGTQ